MRLKSKWLPIRATAVAAGPVLASMAGTAMPLGLMHRLTFTAVAPMRPRFVASACNAG